MTAVVIPAERLEALRRERQRRAEQALAGSILANLLDEEDHPPCSPALPAERKEPPR